MKIDKKSIAREKALKNIPFDAYTISDINFLERQWIFNWVWPSRWWKWLRVLTTYLFKHLKWRRHDDWFWKKLWFHKVNRWLIKYSFLSLWEDYIVICKNKWYKRIPLKIWFFITLPFKVYTITIAYDLVESKWWKKAYDECK